jgi:hypothetical protein
VLTKYFTQKYSYKIMENVRDSSRSVLLVFSQSYVKHDLRKNKIVVTSTAGFSRH